MEVTPIIKCAGGKRQLVPTLLEMIPKKYNTYYEPFFGGGALFCSLQPKKAVINDLNIQLINMYKEIKKNPNVVCEELLNIQKEYNAKDSIEEKDKLYYKLRNDYNLKISSNKKDVASLLIFLNKTGFNGLYRVNSSGLYNVPSGHKKQVNAYNKDNILAFSKVLKHTTILCGDFEKACKDAKKGDLIFFDSPYYNTFNTYQANGFSEDDHIRLFNLYKNLTNKGVFCMLTNNDCKQINDLYKDFNICHVNVKRMINRDANHRTGKEIIITNY